MKSSSSILGLLVCVIYIVNFREREYICDNSSDIGKVGDCFVNAIIVAIAILSVAIFEASIDLLNFQLFPIRMTILFIPRIFFLGGTFLINCYILSIHKNCRTIFDLSISLNFQSFCLIHGCSSIISKYLKSPTLKYLDIAIQVFACISDVLLASINYELKFDSTLGSFAFASSMASVLLLLYFLSKCRSMLTPLTQKHYDKVLCGERVLAFLCVLIICITFIGRIIFICSCLGRHYGSTTQSILLGYHYIHSILCVILSLAQSRISRWSECGLEVY